MAMLRHPVTGVFLNRLEIHRKSLDDLEQVTARLLRRDGHTCHDIAAMLGTNQGRIAEALAGDLDHSARRQQTLF